MSGCVLAPALAQRHQDDLGALTHPVAVLAAMKRFGWTETKRSVLTGCSSKLTGPIVMAWTWAVRRWLGLPATRDITSPSSGSDRTFW
jgi:hypothetical protein